MLQSKLIAFSLFTLFCLSTFSCGSSQEKETSPETKGSAFEQTMSAIDGREIIPLEYRTIYVHHFDNRSYKADLVARLKEKLQIRFNSDGRLKVETEKNKADIWLYGKIEMYKRIPGAYDRFNRPTRFLMSMVVSIRVRVNNALHKESDDTLLDKRLIRFDTEYSPLHGTFESEFSAHERLLETMSERIVYTMYEGWYSELKSEQELGKSKTEIEEDKTRRKPKVENTRNVNERNVLDYIKPDQK